MFIGIWNFSDDSGVMKAKPRAIKMKVFPGDDDAPIPKICTWLNELIDNTLIGLFENNSVIYLYVTGWDEHQRIDKPNPKYPTPFDDDSEIIRGTFEEHSGDVSRTLLCGREGKGRDRKGRDRNMDDSQNASSSPALDKYQQEFEEHIWPVYPKRNGGNPKKPALKAYRASRKRGNSFEDIRAGLGKYINYVKASGKVGSELVMQAQTFFGPNDRWNDDYGNPQANGRIVEDPAARSAREAREYLQQS